MDEVGGVFQQVRGNLGNFFVIYLFFCDFLNYFFSTFEREFASIFGFGFGHRHTSSSLLTQRKGAKKLGKNSVTSNLMTSQVEKEKKKQMRIPSISSSVIGRPVSVCVYLSLFLVFFGCFFCCCCCCCCCSFQQRSKRTIRTHTHTHTHTHTQRSKQNNWRTPKYFALHVVSPAGPTHT